jgi:hypothetical protein
MDRATAHGGREADAAQEYRTRLQARREAHATLTRADARLSHARLATFAAAVTVAVLAARGDLTSWWLLAPAAVFTVLLQQHERTTRARDAALRATVFYERGLARIEDRWAGGGETGERFRDDSHLYATDLDLFGRGSLFELLSIARTQPGEETLAGWLKTTAATDEVAARQAAVRELTTELDLRESVSRAGAAMSTGVNRQALVTWAEGPPILARRALRPISLLFTTVLIVAATLWATGGSSTPFIVIVVLQLFFANLQRGAVEQALHAGEGRAHDLDILAQVLHEIERASFSSPRLQALRRDLDTGGAPASTAIRGLHRLVEMHDWAHNLVFTPIAVALMWDTHLAWAIESWRGRHGRQIGRWLTAVGEFEALSSLSAYRYEHPGDPFPEIVAAQEGAAARDAVFQGTALGHPLLPSDRMVRNDVRLGGDARLLVISGSNMSGKSTLLRTVGINAVLALAGAPVRAAALRVSPLNIGATLRIQDSLQEGRSRFYAEITRIRQLADLARDARPLLFLLDEIFHGTNSHDRLVGAAGVLGTFLDRGAIGLVTTHDLALTAVANELAPRAMNVHFEDWFDRGELQFDYLMKPGPVTRSNAIALMRAVGLEVRDPQGMP